MLQCSTQTNCLPQQSYTLVCKVLSKRLERKANKTMIQVTSVAVNVEFSLMIRLPLYKCYWILLQNKYCG